MSTVQRHTPASTPRPTLAVSRLGGVIGQMRLINGIFAALNASLAIDDLQLILLTVLTAPRGLGFTRAHLFVADEGGQQFTGRLALGCGPQRGLDDIEQEIRGEEQMLTSMLANSAPPGAAMREDLAELRSQSWWITAYQRAQPDNPLTRAIEGRPLLRPRHSLPAPLAGANGDVRALHVRAGTRPRWIDPRTLALLGDEFLLAPLRTQRGLRALVAVDRAQRPGRLSRHDAANLEWLCNQAGLALQNAELYGDLRRAYAELQAVDSMKSNFLSTLSHELKTPLTAILGFVQLILQGKAGEINPTARRLLAKVVDRAHDLGEMVNDLLEIAEIEADGLVQIDREPVVLEDVVERAIQRVAKRRHSADVLIEHRRPERPLPPVLGDQGAIERIFYHLVDNAVKFTPGPGKVTVAYRATAHRVQATVRDTGIGIAPQHLEQIFDRFFQVDGDLSRAYSGVGIGLAVTKKLLTLLGAEIHVTSRLGKGSTFRLTFPITPTAEGAQG